MTMVDHAPFWALFSIGILGSGHCIGMCGGLSSAFAMSVESTHRLPRIVKIVGFQLGRVSSYCLIAMLFGYSLERLSDWVAIKPALDGLRIFANLMLIAMGLYIARWWFGLQWLEKKGSALWKHIQPLTSRLLPVKNLPVAICLGFLWGWIPCGLVYSALVTSISYADGTLSSLYMLGFGLGTVPSMLFTGLAANHLKTTLSSPLFRIVAGICVILYAVSQLLQPLLQGL